MSKFLFVLLLNFIVGNLVSASLLDHADIGLQRGFECDRQVMTTDPTQLRRGKAFRKKMQADWLKTAQGIVSKEKVIIPFRVINSREGGFKLLL